MHRTHHHVRRELVDGALHRLGVARARLGLETDVDVDLPHPFRLQAPRFGEVAAKALADRPQPDALVLWNRQRVRRRHVLRQAHPRETGIDVRLYHVRQRIHGMGAELPAVSAVNRNQLHRHTHMMPFPGGTWCWWVWPLRSAMRENGYAARSTSKAAMLRASRLNSTPIRWTGRPGCRYLSAYPRALTCARALSGGARGACPSHERASPRGPRASGRSLNSNT